MMLWVIGLLFVVVVAPIWIVAHYATNWRTARMLSREHERTLAEIWDLTQRLEGRMETLERILDADAPGWRARTDDAARGPR
ncbi:MAG: envelope stress response membrane protein PspB [Rhodospirillales bacterium]|jgi:phage shock protein B|nr:envelope stress response membrane protein PspB [Rhodospirillales bacterium]